METNKQSKRDLLGKRKPYFIYIHCLLDYPFVAFKGSEFLRLTVQLLVILLINSVFQ